MFTAKSTRFLAELARRHREFAQKPIRARIVIPEDMKWLWYQEYGTGLAGPSHSTYKIRPKFKDWLQWPDPEDKYSGLNPAVFGTPGQGVARRFVVSAHPGVKPTHMVRNAIPDAARAVLKDFANSLVASGWNRQVVKVRLTTVSMVEAKHIITLSIEESLPGRRTDEYAKLGGKSAAEVFDTAATIKDSGL